jgi:hypothetical protein
MLLIKWRFCTAYETQANNTNPSSIFYSMANTAKILPQYAEHTELAGSLRIRKVRIGDMKLIIPASVKRLTRAAPSAKTGAKY